MASSSSAAASPSAAGTIWSGSIAVPRPGLPPMPDERNLFALLSWRELRQAAIQKVYRERAAELNCPSHCPNKEVEKKLIAQILRDQPHLSSDEADGAVVMELANSVLNPAPILSQVNGSLDELVASRQLPELTDPELQNKLEILLCLAEHTGSISSVCFLPTNPTVKQTQRLSKGEPKSFSIEEALHDGDAVIVSSTYPALDPRPIPRRMQQLNRQIFQLLRKDPQTAGVAYSYSGEDLPEERRFVLVVTPVCKQQGRELETPVCLSENPDRARSDDQGQARRPSLKISLAGQQAERGAPFREDPELSRSPQSSGRRSVFSPEPCIQRHLFCPTPEVDKELYQLQQCELTAPPVSIDAEALELWRQANSQEKV